MIFIHVYSTRDFQNLWYRRFNIFCFHLGHTIGKLLQRIHKILKLALKHIISLSRDNISDNSNMSKEENSSAEIEPLEI